MLTPGSAIGRYVVQRKLAEGGMAEIYLCTMVGPGGFAKEVVLKVVRAFLANDAGFVKMFVDEARLASRLNHANVVQLFDFGQHDDRYYIAMEYVRGGTVSELKKRCAAAGVGMPPTLAADICARVARGLHHAHTLTERGKPAGLVHRDVTPQNILLAFDGAVKLTDFGIAKANSSATAPGMLKGKYAYMAPEQARGEAVDARTDVFALGITLWELLTGARLFDGASDLAVLRAVQESVIAPPSRLNPEVPPALSAIALKALCREPRGRYQTAAELEEALSQFVVQNARALEDTRVDLFMRPLYPEEHDEAPARPTGSIALADTLLGETLLGDRTLDGDVTLQPGDAPIRPTSPTHLALSAARSPTAPGPELQPAGAKTDRQPGLRQSVPRLERSLATPAAARTTDPATHTVSAEEKPGVPTASMRRSVKFTPVEEPSAAPTDDRGALPAPEPSAPPLAPTPVAPATNWLSLALGVVAAGALGLAGLALTTRDEPVPSAPAIVELKPASEKGPAGSATSGADRPAPPPEPAPREPTAAAPEPTSPDAEKPGPTEAPRDARPNPTEGYLDIYARPYANLFINGAARGEVVGHRLVKLKPGKYTVALKHLRSELSPTSYTVRAGEKTRIIFTASE